MVLLPAGILIAAAGWLDDRCSLSAGVRLPIHLLAAGIGLYFLHDLPALNLYGWEVDVSGWWGYLPLLVALAWCVNLNNFMDGIDSIASAEAICVAGGAALILVLNGGNPGLVRVLVLLVAVTVGFLYWNRPPARMFMGDAGSGFLGLAIGLLALETSAGGGVNLWTWLILYGLFMVDATFTLLRRIIRKERFFAAHRSHAYQILSRRWGSHGKVTMAVVIINICWLFPMAVVSSRYPGYGMPVAAAALLPLILLAARIGAGTTNG
jgi:Fuc2NAc and GlcNAc transferase